PMTSPHRGLNLCSDILIATNILSQIGMCIQTPSCSHRTHTFGAASMMAKEVEEDELPYKKAALTNGHAQRWTEELCHYVENHQCKRSLLNG
ncbi:MAG: hypothetical protein ACFFAX_16895, partial [Promethearchaeota archaeon]